jgi:flagellar hook-associated protein 2
MSSFDPITMATQLATFDVQPFQTRYQMQSDNYQNKIDAFGKIESALREFRTAITEMNSSTSSIVKNSASLSQEGFMSASANANALAGSYQVFVEQLATSHQINTGMPANLDSTTQIPTTGTLDLTIDGNTLSLDLSTVDTDGDGIATMADLTKAINNHADNPGVNATLVRSGGQTHFMLSSNETGAANALSVSASGTGQAWFEDAFSNVTELSAAKDATIWLGAEGSGLQLTNSSNTFSNVIEGVDLTVSKAQNSGDAPITLTVGNDEEASKEQMNKLVDAYNSLLSTIDEYTKSGGEDSSRGILAGDPTIRSLESQINNILRGEHNGMRLSQVGLSFNTSGELELDSEKFAEAQRNNSAALEEMFNGTDMLLDSLDAVADPFLKSTTGLFKTRKDSLEKNIDRIDDKLAGLDRKYDMAYNRYLSQFTQMNTLMTQMNQTMSMFG